MRTIKKRVEIVVFEQKRTTWRHSEVMCPMCGLRSEMLTAEHASSQLQVQLEQLHQFLKQGRIHGVKTPEGEDLICRNSLFH